MIRLILLSIVLILGFNLGETFAAETLERAVSSRMERVNEFRFIREQAEKMGVRVWLFGGTAAGYGHYVKWDLARESGDKRFQKDRFDYDYTNIFRSTQDLDIVIDGTPEQVQAMQTLLEEKFPHLQGKRTAWEVRSLTQKVRDKEPLLDNPDFLNQHTDSNSTGMIEITEPKNNEPVIRDLRDWKNSKPAFLTDLKGDKLHYYFSPDHFTTNRAKEGLNPPILSALRYLTKAFQYELEIDPKSLKHLKKIIADFDPERDLTTDYAKEQLEKNAKKMIQHSVNMEYARETLDELGLREKLLPLGDLKVKDSMAWWLNKMPLQSSKVGEGDGKTAAELARELGWPIDSEGRIIVSHETNNYLAYESITRAHTGDPNVLISRRGIEGELAAHGDGFYTKVGKEGARGTGLTIRFTLDPNARLGTDFTLRTPGVGNSEADNFVILQNKKAIRVIQESLNLPPVDYFRFLANAESLDESDKALMEKLGRRSRAKFSTLSKKEMAEIQEIVLANFRENNLKNGALMSEWFSIPQSVKFSDPILENALPGNNHGHLASFLISHKHWQSHPFLKKFSLKQAVRSLSVMGSGLRSEATKVAEYFLGTIKPKEQEIRAMAEELAQSILRDPEKVRWNPATDFWFSFPWAFKPEANAALQAMRSDKINYRFLLQKTFEGGQIDYLKKYPDLLSGAPEYTVGSAIDDLGYRARADVLEYLLEAIPPPKLDVPIAKKLMNADVKQNGAWARMVGEILSRGLADSDIAGGLHKFPAGAQYPEWVDTLLARGKWTDQIAISVLQHPEIWKPNDKWMDEIFKTRGIAKGDTDQYLAGALRKPEWKARPGWRKWVDTLLAKEEPNSALFTPGILQPADIDALLERDTKFTDRNIVFLLSKEWENKDAAPEFRDRAWVQKRLDAMVKRGTADANLTKLFLALPEWQNESEWFDTVARRGEDRYGFIDSILSQPFSADHPEWLFESLKFSKDSSERHELIGMLDARILVLPHWNHHPKLRALVPNDILSTSSLQAALERARRNGVDPLTVHGKDCPADFSALAAGR